MSTNYPTRMDLDVRVAMRDGVELSADIYLPDSPGKYPALLNRTPYSNNEDDTVERARFMAGQGYAVVVQDVRGRWDSDGVYYPFTDEADDGFDTQQWIGEQPWSNGKIGTYGSSYGGMVQWQAAPQASPYLTCMAPRVGPSDFWDHWVYSHGAFQLGFMGTWGMTTNSRTNQNIDFHDWATVFKSLPIAETDEAAGRSVGFWKDWVAHSSYDDYWMRLTNRGKYGQVKAPAYNLGGWYDIFVAGTFENFSSMRKHGGSPEARKSKLLCGPWMHPIGTSTKTGDIDFGGHSLVDIGAEELRWFDYWLKGEDNGIADEPPIRLFIMGSNVWRDEHEWPLDRTDWQKWYLHSGGNANTLHGDGTLSPDTPSDEPADTFVYDPMVPVQTLGGNNCCNPEIVPWGPYDQRPVEMRGDVLCYTSAPLEKDVEVTGPIKLTLFAESDARDTDWTGKLVDVRPDGYALNLCDGIVRARFRDDPVNPTLVDPGKVYEYRLDLDVTGNVFKRGHRIRIDVSSSNFPRFDRNLNTGGVLGRELEFRTARQTIHHSSRYPSHVTLPVIPPA
ncbi:MAG: CocE/NonD family hydrolase [Chloroflexi bacterium]|nr:CocE/NonD family hydrolase [Chloroflexota bacterium]MCY3936894.1 CocE/NonD family hydrolase [Chloroflexota bacterium]